MSQRLDKTTNTDFGVNGAEVKTAENILVVLERTSIVACTHEVVV